eukprot:8309585-Heterocapsa_arctica.AAC.1
MRPLHSPRLHRPRDLGEPPLSVHRSGARSSAKSYLTARAPRRRHSTPIRELLGRRGPTGQPPAPLPRGSGHWVQLLLPLRHQRWATRCRRRYFTRRTVAHCRSSVLLCLSHVGHRRAAR